MENKRTIIISGKESFVVRVLVKKVADAGVECSFVPADVNSIHAAFEDLALATVYLDEKAPISKDVLHFICEKADEKGIHVILIGEDGDLDMASGFISPEMVYKKFTRPVDNEKYVSANASFFEKMEAGDFKKSILVVDDDPQYLGLVREWLKGTYKVSMANSGLQAIKWLGKNKVDLILLDHEMPVTTGPQVLEMLRSDNETASIPVIFLTGKGDKESVMAVVALKPEGYFLKNIKKDELLQKLEEFFLSRKQ